MSRPVYYQESGIFPLYAVPLMLLAGVVTAAIGAPILAFLGLLFGGCWLWFIVFGVAAVVHGFAAMFAVMFTSQLAQVRNQKVTLACGIFVCLVACYLFMHSVLWITINPDWAEFFPLLNPANLYATTVAYINAAPDPTTTGVWVIGTSIFAFILFMFVAYALGTLEVDPYCEKCGRWTSEHKPRLHIEPPSAAALGQEFEEGDFSALLSPKRQSRARHYAELTFFECESCNESSYLRVTSVTKTPKKDKPGEYDVETKTVVNLIRVPQGLHNALMEQVWDEQEQAKSKEVDQPSAFDVGEAEE